jgi:anti-sigma regulatory factor (Ser/Thr protein kinase)
VTPVVSRVPTTRRRVVRAAQRHGVDPEASDALAIVVGELVANAVRHARPLPDGNIVVSWGQDGDGIRVEVTDGGGSTEPHLVATSPLATSGRGLALVGAYADAWGWSAAPAGRMTVWARIPCAPAGAVSPQLVGDLS